MSVLVSAQIFVVVRNGRCAVAFHESARLFCRSTIIWKSPRFDGPSHGQLSWCALTRRRARSITLHAPVPGKTIALSGNTISDPSQLSPSNRRTKSYVVGRCRSSTEVPCACANTRLDGVQTIASAAKTPNARRLTVSPATQCATADLVIRTRAASPSHSPTLVLRRCSA